MKRRHWSARGLSAAAAMTLGLTVWLMADQSGTAVPPKHQEAVPRVLRPEAGAGPNRMQAAPVRDAATGRVLLHGPRLAVDRVAGPMPLVRLTITGRFVLRDLDPTVFVDGRAVGTGIVTPDLRMLRIALPGPVKAGASVTYRYGSGSPLPVGTLRAGR